MTPTIPYPRICAHRGLPARLPENTLPSFAAAVEAGAQEIEFDLRPLDGRLVVSHDAPKGSAERLPALEEVLRQFGGCVVMNIHIKPPQGGKDYDRAVFQSIVEAIDQYDCRRHVYFTGTAAVMEAALALAPDIERCCQQGNKDFTIVENALKYKAQKLQFFKPHYTQALIDEARAHGIRCNMFYADSLREARKFFRMGIDTVLTNNCARILKALEEFQ